LWALQVLASEEVKKLTADELANYIRYFTNQRPKLESLYLFACFMIGLELEGPLHCKEISLAGLEAFPTSWRIAMTQGFIHTSVLNEPAQGAVYFHMASQFRESPPYVANLARRLMNSRVLTPTDIEESLAVLSKVPGGSKFQDFISDAAKRKEEVEQTSPWLKHLGPEAP
jgi:hypothetical protein